MQRLKVIFLGTLAVLPLCSFGAVNVEFSSGKFSSDGQHMETGKNGHAQAALDTRGSLIRFGSITVADLGQEREVTLSKGLLLVSSGEGFLRRPGVVIHTPEGNVTVRGTALVAVLPDGAVKLTCLEGGARGDLGGHGVSLHPGELVIQRGDGTRDIVQVNLHSLAGTCALLVGEGFKPLHFAGSIDEAVAKQDKAFAGAHFSNASQHMAGHSPGESTSFLARLFSSHGNVSNNFGGSVGGATMTLAQGGAAGGSMALSGVGGTLALADNSMLRASSMGVLTNAVSSNQGAASLTVASNFQQQLLAGSGGTLVQTNNVGSGIQNGLSGATIVSGSSLTLSSGGQQIALGGQGSITNASSTLVISGASMAAAPSQT